MYLIRILEKIESLPPPSAAALTRRIFSRKGDRVFTWKGNTREVMVSRRPLFLVPFGVEKKESVGDYGFRPAYHSSEVNMRIFRQH